MGDVLGDMVQRGANVSADIVDLGENMPVTVKATHDLAADLLRTLEKSVEDLRGLVSCRICIRPMYEPYTIACGHTFCYSCLAQWFSNHSINKTCPDCRTKVTQQPAPAYLVREMTQLFISRAELMPWGENTEDHKKCQVEEAFIIEQDRLNTDRKTGGLFRGNFRKVLSRNRPILRDDEDGVSRCPNCAWELEDGICNSCGVAYRSDGEAYSVDSLSFSEDYESDLSNRHFEDASDNLDTDDEEELAALVEMNEDISLDGEGHSVHADYANMTGNATFGRADAHGLARQFRHPENLTTAFRHRYAPSMLSDVATHDEDNDRNELTRFSDASNGSDASDEDTGSLDDFIDDKFDDSGTDDERNPSFSPILSDRDDNYTTRSRNYSGRATVHSDDETLSSGYAADRNNADDDDHDSESNESQTASSPSHRGHSRELSRPSNRRRHAWSETSPELSNQGTPNLSARNSRLLSRQARPAQRNLPEPTEIPSDSGSPVLPQRSRKRRYVVDDRSSDDDSGSDVNISRPRKRKGSSSGSMTVGR